MNLVKTHPVPRQKFVLQSIAFITLGTAFILVWNALKKTDGVYMQASVAMLPRLLGDLSLILPLSLLAILLGIASAFYLEEWLPKANWFRRLIESHVSLLTGIPSLLYGLLTIAIFFGYAGVFKMPKAALLTQNVAGSASETMPFQRDISLFYAEVFTFILLVMPVAIKTTQEALRSVATPLRESAYALGANQWQVLAKQVIPLAFPRMLAGACRAMARALAAAALLIGIYTWGYTAASREMADRFMLFLSGALFLSIFSSILMDINTPASTRHN